MVEQPRLLDTDSILRITPESLTSAQATSLVGIMRGYVMEELRRQALQQTRDQQGIAYIEDRNAKQQAVATHHACVHALLLLLQRDHRVPQEILEAFQLYGSFDLHTFDTQVGVGKLPELEQRARTLRSELSAVSGLEAAFIELNRLLPRIQSTEAGRWNEVREMVEAILTSEDNVENATQRERKTQQALRTTTRALIASMGLSPAHLQWFPHIKKYIDLLEIDADIQRIKGGQLPLQGTNLESIYPGIEKRVPLYRQIFALKGWTVTAPVLRR